MNKPPLNRPPLKWGWAETEQGIVETARALGIEYDHRVTYPQLKQLCFQRLVELKNKRAFTFVPEEHAIAVLRAVEALGFQIVQTTAEGTAPCSADHVLHALLQAANEAEVVRDVVSKVTKSKTKRRVRRL